MNKPETKTHYASRNHFAPVRKFVGENPFSKYSGVDIARLLDATELCYEAVERDRKTRVDAKFFRDMLHLTPQTEKWVGYVPFGEEEYCELFADAPLQLALMLEARKRAIKSRQLIVNLKK